MGMSRLEPKELSVRRGSVVIELTRLEVSSTSYASLVRYFDYTFGNKGEWYIKWIKNIKAH